MIDGLFNGLRALGNGPAIGYLFLGSLLGMFIGVIPGLGGPVVLTVILAFVYHINLTGTLCLFLATQAGSYFSASITSILLNTPAHPEAFAVTFDGFPMAQRGEAGRALGISATSTCIGGLIGCAVLVGFIQIINDLPTVFHPPEQVALIVIALLLVGTFGTDAVSKSLISTGIALMLASIGSDPVTGVFRYTFSAVGLYGGISIVGLFLGLFAIPQMVLVFGTGSTIARQNMMGQEVDRAAPVALERGFGKQVIGGVGETLTHWGALLRAALIGVVTGIIPGIGGFAANFMSYGVAQQMSKKRELFGTGIAEGIIAPEGSSLAKEAGGMVPVFGLGIAGSIGSALFLAALAIKGVKSGYGFTTQYPTLAYEAVWIIALGGLIGTLAGVLSAPILAKVTRVPGPALVPFVMGISVVGAFVSDVAFFSVMEIIVFAFVGFALRRLRYSLAAFGLGLILGPTLETNIYLTHTVYPGFSFLEKRPLADVLFLVAIALLVIKTIQLRQDAKKANPPIEESDPLLRAAEIRRRDRLRHPYPLLGMIVTVLLVGFCSAFAIYGGLEYNFTTALMPVLGSGVAAVIALWRLPREVAGYVNYRRETRELRNLAEGAGFSAEVIAEIESGEPVLQGAGAPIDSSAGLSSRLLPDETAAPAPSAVAPEITPSAPRQPAGDRFPAIKDKSWGINGQYSREILAFGWFIALVALCFLFGFDIAVAVFALAYGLTSMRRIIRTWRGRILFAVASAGVLLGASYEMQHLLHTMFTPVF